MAAAQSIRLSPDSPNIAAVACPGSREKFAGMPTEPIACVAASGCASQQENAAAFMKKRIVRFSAFVRTHSVRVLVLDKTDCADKPARGRHARIRWVSSSDPYIEKPVCHYVIHRNSPDCNSP